MAVPFLMMATALVRLAVVLDAACAEDVFVGHYGQALLDGGIAWVVLAFAGLIWRFGIHHIRHP